MELIKKIGIAVALIGLVGIGSAVSYNMIADPSSPSLFADVLNDISFGGLTDGRQTSFTFQGENTEGFREINFDTSASDQDLQENVSGETQPTENQIELLNDLRNDTNQFRATPTEPEEVLEDDTTSSLREEVQPDTQNTTFFQSTQEPAACATLKEDYSETQRANTQAMLNLVRNNCTNTAQVAARGQFTNVGGERLLSQTGASGFVGDPVISDIPEAGLDFGLFKIFEKECVHCSLDKAVVERFKEFKEVENADNTSVADQKYQEYIDAIDACIKKTREDFSSGKSERSLCPIVQVPCDECYDTKEAEAARMAFENILLAYGRSSQQALEYLMKYKEILGKCKRDICPKDSTVPAPQEAPIPPIVEKPCTDCIQLKSYDDPSKDPFITHKRDYFRAYEQLVRAKQSGTGIDEAEAELQKQEQRLLDAIRLCTEAVERRGEKLCPSNYYDDRIALFRRIFEDREEFVRPIFEPGGVVLSPIPENANKSDIFTAPNNETIECFDCVQETKIDSNTKMPLSSCINYDVTKAYLDRVLELAKMNGKGGLEPFEDELDQLENAISNKMDECINRQPEACRSRLQLKKDTYLKNMNQAYDNMLQNIPIERPGASTP